MEGNNCIVRTVNGRAYCALNSGSQVRDSLPKMRMTVKDTGMGERTRRKKAIPDRSGIVY